MGDAESFPPCGLKGLDLGTAVELRGASELGCHHYESLVEKFLLL